MNKKSILQSAFFTPRVLICFGLSSLGVLLALLGFFAFPSSALAAPACADVTYEEHTETYGGPVYVKMFSDAGCTIFYNISATVPPNPTHNGGTATLPTQKYPTTAGFEGVGVSRGTARYFKAIAYKPSPYVDSQITEYWVDNTAN
jgi:hypothetical protein